VTDRYTRKDALAAFERLACQLQGVETALAPVWTRDGNSNIARVGALVLDYNPTYGGAVIGQITNEGGGERHLGRRQSPSEFCAAIRLVEDLMYFGLLKATSPDAPES